MKIILNFILIALFVIFTSCSGKKEKAISLESVNLEEQMIEAYKKGFDALESGDIFFAVKNFNSVETIYPQSIWASKSILMSAYAYYSQDYYGDSIYELKRFIKKYPLSNDISYAYFLLANCYYELIVDEKKDLSSLLEAKKYFKYLIENYPDTDFALDSKFKINLIDNILASKEIYVGRYYLQKKKWIPAINRFKTVIVEYEETEYVEEALHRLVEVYYKIGLEEESRKYASLLGYNYLSSEWYEKSFRVFNKDYKKQNIENHKKLSVLEKFKNLF